MEHKVINDYTGITPEGSDSIKVIVRAQPPPKNCTQEESCFMSRSTDNPRRLLTNDPHNTKIQHAFLFNDIIWHEASQEKVFHATIEPLIDHCFEGYNGCCFAYGQTGSGKTYTMFGDPSNPMLAGIVPRTIERVFEKVKGLRTQDEEKSVQRMFEISTSFLEIYCDELRDLSPNAKRTDKEVTTRNRFEANNAEERDRERKNQLRIAEDFEGKVYVHNLDRSRMSTAAAALLFLKDGLRSRSVNSTKMNSKSSRSHVIFSITILRRISHSTRVEETVATLNLVDLAGSERLAKSESEGQRLREALFINTSLSALGKVIMALDPGFPSPYIPYRESKLTRVLQDSLGGNSHTCVIGTVNPIRDNYDESLSTLHFVNRCRNVVNKPRVNYRNNELKAKEITIKRLNKEIMRLRILVAVIIHRKNNQIKGILTGLGIKKFKLLKDGRVVLPNGKVIGARFDLNMVEHQVSNMIAEQENSGNPIINANALISEALRMSDNSSQNEGRIESQVSDSKSGKTGQEHIEKTQILQNTINMLKAKIIKLKSAKIDLKCTVKQLEENEKQITQELRKEIGILNNELSSTKVMLKDEIYSRKRHIKVLTARFSRDFSKLAGFRSVHSTKRNSKLEEKKKKNTQGWFSPNKQEKLKPKKNKPKSTSISWSSYENRIEELVAFYEKELADVRNQRRQEIDKRCRATEDLETNKHIHEKSMQRMSTSCKSLLDILQSVQNGKYRLRRYTNSEIVTVALTRRDLTNMNAAAELLNSSVEEEEK